MWVPLCLSSLRPEPNSSSMVHATSLCQFWSSTACLLSRRNPAMSALCKTFVLASGALALTGCDGPTANAEAYTSFLEGLRPETKPIAIDAIKAGRVFALAGSFMTRSALGAVGSC